jgi:hypothetical protein
VRSDALPCEEPELSGNTEDRISQGFFISLHLGALLCSNGVRGIKPIRNPMLYPFELRALKDSANSRLRVLPHDKGSDGCFPLRFVATLSGRAFLFPLLTRS